MECRRISITSSRLSDYESNLIAFVDVSGNMGTATGKRFFLPGLFFEAHSNHPFVAQDKRTTLIDVHYPKLEIDQVTYHLPAEFAVETPPQAAISRGLTMLSSR